MRTSRALELSLGVNTQKDGVGWGQRSPSVPSGLYIASLYTHYKRAKVYLYGSHVWLGLITYGGIILSFIKRVGAEEGEHVCKLNACMHPCACQCLSVRVSEEGIAAPKDPFRANIVYHRRGGEGGEQGER